MASIDQNVSGNTYDKYESTNPVEKRMMAGFLGALDMMLDGLEPTTVLEVGAGEGRITAILSERMPSATPVGLDLPDDGLAAEWGAVATPMIFADATDLPFPSKSIELVVILEVLEHIPDPIRALHEIERVCSGTVIASVPREPIWRLGNMTRGRYLRDLGNTPGHVNHWSARGFRSFVESAFAVDAARRPLPWTMLRATPRQPA